MIDGYRPTFGSLFAGIGGFDLGLERAGWVPRWQVEIDERCRQDNCDYSVANGGQMRVRVTGATGITRWFDVSGVILPHYTARPVADEHSDGEKR